MSGRPVKRFLECGAFARSPMVIFVPHCPRRARTGSTSRLAVLVGDFFHLSCRYGAHEVAGTRPRDRAFRGRWAPRHVSPQAISSASFRRFPRPFRRRTASILHRRPLPPREVAARFSTLAGLLPTTGTKGRHAGAPGARFRPPVLFAGLSFPLPSVRPGDPSRIVGVQALCRSTRFELLSCSRTRVLRLPAAPRHLRARRGAASAPTLALSPGAPRPPRATAAYAPAPPAGRPSTAGRAPPPRHTHPPPATAPR